MWISTLFPSHLLSPNFHIKFHSYLVSEQCAGCRPRLKCDGTRAETRLRLSAKRTSPFKSAESTVQSTTGSRGVCIKGSGAGYTMFRGSVKGTGYPLHSPVFPSLPLPASPCTITFQLDSTDAQLHANCTKINTEHGRIWTGDSSVIIFCTNKDISVQTFQFIEVRYSWDCVVGMLTPYGLEVPRIESRWVARFSVLAQTGCGAHPSSTLGIRSRQRG